LMGPVPRGKREKGDEKMTEGQKVQNHAKPMRSATGTGR